MASVSYSELRANLSSYMDKVCDDRAPLLVTRQNSRSVVIMAEAEYEALLETFHLLTSPANAARLLTSLDEADRDKLAEHDLIDDVGA